MIFLASLAVSTFALRADTAGPQTCNFAVSESYVLSGTDMYNVTFNFANSIKSKDSSMNLMLMGLSGARLSGSLSTCKYNGIELLSDSLINLVPTGLNADGASYSLVCSLESTNNPFFPIVYYAIDGYHTADNMGLVCVSDLSEAATRASLGDGLVAINRAYNVGSGAYVEVLSADLFDPEDATTTIDGTAPAKTIQVGDRTIYAVASAVTPGTPVVIAQNSTLFTLDVPAVDTLAAVDVTGVPVTTIVVPPVARVCGSNAACAPFFGVPATGSYSLVETVVKVVVSRDNAGQAVSAKSFEVSIAGTGFDAATADLQCKFLLIDVNSGIYDLNQSQDAAAFVTKTSATATQVVASVSGLTGPLFEDGDVFHIVCATNVATAAAKISAKLVLADDKLVYPVSGASIAGISATSEGVWTIESSSPSTSSTYGYQCMIVKDTAYSITYTETLIEPRGFVVGGRQVGAQVTQFLNATNTADEVYYNIEYNSVAAGAITNGSNKAHLVCVVILNKDSTAFGAIQIMNGDSVYPAVAADVEPVFFGSVASDRSTFAVADPVKKTLALAVYGFELASNMGYHTALDFDVTAPTFKYTVTTGFSTAGAICAINSQFTTGAPVITTGTAGFTVSFTPTGTFSTDFDSFFIGFVECSNVDLSAVVQLRERSFAVTVEILAGAVLKNAFTTTYPVTYTNTAGSGFSVVGSAEFAPVLGGVALDMSITVLGDDYEKAADDTVEIVLPNGWITIAQAFTCDVAINGEATVYKVATVIEHNSLRFDIGSSAIADGTDITTANFKCANLGPGAKVVKDEALLFVLRTSADVMPFMTIVPNQYVPSNVVATSPGNSPIALNAAKLSTVRTFSHAHLAGAGTITATVTKADGSAAAPGVTAAVAAVGTTATKVTVTATTGAATGSYTLTVSFVPAAQPAPMVAQGLNAAVAEAAVAPFVVETFTFYVATSSSATCPATALTGAGGLVYEYEFKNDVLKRTTICPAGQFTQVDAVQTCVGSSFGANPTCSGSVTVALADSKAAPGYFFLATAPADKNAATSFVVTVPTAAALDGRDYSLTLVSASGNAVETARAAEYCSIVDDLAAPSSLASGKVVSNTKISGYVYCSADFIVAGGATLALEFAVPSAGLKTTSGSLKVGAVLVLIPANVDLNTDAAFTAPAVGSKLAKYVSKETTVAIVGIATDGVSVPGSVTSTGDCGVTATEVTCTNTDKATEVTFGAVAGVAVFDLSVTISACNFDQFLSDYTASGSSTVGFFDAATNTGYAYCTGAANEVPTVSTFTCVDGEFAAPAEDIVCAPVVCNLDDLYDTAFPAAERTLANGYLPVTYTVSNGESTKNQFAVQVTLGCDASKDYYPAAAGAFLETATASYYCQDGQWIHQLTLEAANPNEITCKTSRCPYPGHRSIVGASSAFGFFVPAEVEFSTGLGANGVIANAGGFAFAPSTTDFNRLYSNATYLRLVCPFADISTAVKNKAFQCLNGEWVGTTDDTETPADIQDDACGTGVGRCPAVFPDDAAFEGLTVSPSASRFANAAYTPVCDDASKLFMGDIACSDEGEWDATFTGECVENQCKAFEFDVTKDDSATYANTRALSVAADGTILKTVCDWGYTANPAFSVSCSLDTSATPFFGFVESDVPCVPVQSTEEICLAYADAAGESALFGQQIPDYIAGIYAAASLNPVYPSVKRVSGGALVPLRQQLDETYVALKGDELEFACPSFYTLTWIYLGPTQNLEYAVDAATAGSTARATCDGSNVVLVNGKAAYPFCAATRCEPLGSATNAVLGAALAEYNQLELSEIVTAFASLVPTADITVATEVNEKVSFGCPSGSTASLTAVFTCQMSSASGINYAYWSAMFNDGTSSSDLTSIPAGDFVAALTCNAQTCSLEDLFRVIDTAHVRVGKEIGGVVVDYFTAGTTAVDWFQFTAAEGAKLSLSCANGKILTGIPTAFSCVGSQFVADGEVIDINTFTPLCVDEVVDVCAAFPADAKFTVEYKDRVSGAAVVAPFGIETTAYVKCASGYIPDESLAFGPITCDPVTGWSATDFESHCTPGCLAFGTDGSYAQYTYTYAFDGIYGKSAPADVVYYSVGAIVEAGCAAGHSTLYGARKTNRYQCVQDGATYEWEMVGSVTPITCVPTVRCDAPPALAQGSVDVSGLDTFQVGATVTYSCGTGYDLFGGPVDGEPIGVVTCKADTADPNVAASWVFNTTWDKANAIGLECRPAACEQPAVADVPAGFTVAYSSAAVAAPIAGYPIGTKASLQCSASYDVNPAQADNALQCARRYQPDGTVYYKWVPVDDQVYGAVADSCVPVKCTAAAFDLLVAANGGLAPTFYQEELIDGVAHYALAEVQCPAGQQVPVKSFKCYNGQWIHAYGPAQVFVPDNADYYCAPYATCDAHTALLAADVTLAKGMIFNAPAFAAEGTVVAASCANPLHAATTAAPVWTCSCNGPNGECEWATSAECAATQCGAPVFGVNVLVSSSASYADQDAFDALNGVYAVGTALELVCAEEGEALAIGSGNTITCNKFGVWEGSVSCDQAFRLGDVVIAGPTLVHIPFVGTPAYTVASDLIASEEKCSQYFDGNASFLALLGYGATCARDSAKIIINLGEDFQLRPYTALDIDYQRFMSSVFVGQQYVSEQYNLKVVGGVPAPTITVSLDANPNTCSPFTFDASASTGGNGFALMYAYELVGGSAQQQAAFARVIAAKAPWSNTPFLATSSPQSNGVLQLTTDEVNEIFTVDTAYAITVTITNWVGLSATQTFPVTFSNVNAPFLRLSAEEVAVTTSEDVATIAQATVSPCAAPGVDVQVSWELASFSAGATDASAIVAAQTADFRLSAGSLLPGTYVFTATAVQRGGVTSPSVSVSFTAVVSPTVVVAVVKGVSGAAITHNIASAFALDASASYDPALLRSADSAAGLSFQWSCTVTGTAQSCADASGLPAEEAAAVFAPTTKVLSLPADVLAEVQGMSADFTVTVSKYGAAASQTVTVAFVGDASVNIAGLSSDSAVATADEDGNQVFLQRDDAALTLTAAISGPANAAYVSAWLCNSEIAMAQYASAWKNAATVTIQAAGFAGLATVECTYYLSETATEVPRTRQAIVDTFDKSATAVVQVVAMPKLASPVCSKTPAGSEYRIDCGLVGASAATVTYKIYKVVDGSPILLASGPSAVFYSTLSVGNHEFAIVATTALGATLAYKWTTAIAASATTPAFLANQVNDAVSTGNANLYVSAMSDLFVQLASSADTVNATETRAAMLASLTANVGLLAGAEGFPSTKASASALVLLSQLLSAPAQTTAELREDAVAFQFVVLKACKDAGVALTKTQADAAAGTLNNAIAAVESSTEANAVAAAFTKQVPLIAAAVLANAAPGSPAVAVSNGPVTISASRHTLSGAAAVFAGASQPIKVGASFFEQLAEFDLDAIDAVAVTMGNNAFVSAVGAPTPAQSSSALVGLSFYAPDGSAIDTSAGLSVEVTIAHPGGLYSANHHLVSCQFLREDNVANAAAELDAWSSAGCSVERSVQDQTVCKCNHLTLFRARAGSPAQSANEWVDLNTKNLMDYNPTAFYVVIVFLGALIVFTLIAYLTDMSKKVRGAELLAHQWNTGKSPATSPLPEEASTCDFVLKRTGMMLGDYHLLFSVALRNILDSVASAPRMFAAVMVYLTAFALNAMFWGGQYAREDLNNYGGVIFIAGLIMVPVALIFKALLAVSHSYGPKEFVYDYATEVAKVYNDTASNYFSPAEQEVLLKSKNAALAGAYQRIVSLNDTGAVEERNALLRQALKLDHIAVGKAMRKNDVKTSVAAGIVYAFLFLWGVAMSVIICAFGVQLGVTVKTSTGYWIGSSFATIGVEIIIIKPVLFFLASIFAVACSARKVEALPVKRERALTVYALDQDLAAIEYKEVPKAAPAPVVEEDLEAPAVVAKAAEPEAADEVVADVEVKVDAAEGDAAAKEASTKDAPVAEDAEAVDADATPALSADSAAKEDSVKAEAAKEESTKKEDSVKAEEPAKEASVKKDAEAEATAAAEEAN